MGYDHVDIRVLTISEVEEQSRRDWVRVSAQGAISKHRTVRVSCWGAYRRAENGHVQREPNACGALDQT